MKDFELVQDPHQRPVICFSPENLRASEDNAIVRDEYHGEAVLRDLLRRLRRIRIAKRRAKEQQKDNVEYARRYFLRKISASVHEAMLANEKKQHTWYKDALIRMDIFDRRLDYIQKQYIRVTDALLNAYDRLAQYEFAPFSHEEPADEDIPF